MTDNRRLLCWAAALAAASALAAPSSAQRALDELAPPDSIGVGDLFIDFSVPDLAAYTLLGVGTNQVTRPKDFRSLGASVLDAVTLDGEDADGVGIEVAPYRALLRPPRNIVEYGRNYLLYRLTTSLASVRTEEATRLAFGFRWVPVDRGDPLLDPTLHAVARAQLQAILDRRGGLEDTQPIQNEALLLFDEVLDDPIRAEELTEEYFPSIPATGTPPPAPTEAAIAAALATKGATLTAVQQALLEGLVTRYENVVEDASEADVMTAAGEAVRSAREDFRRRSWNAMAVQLAAGITATAPGSVWDSLKADQLTAFGGVALPACPERCQLIAQGRLDYAFDDEEDEPVSFGLGARFLYGTDAVHFSLEGAYNGNEQDAEDEGGSNWRVTLGGELKLSSGLWLELATGLNLPEGEEQARVLTLGSLKYGFRESSRFSAGP